MNEKTKTSERSKTIEVAFGDQSEQIELKVDLWNQIKEEAQRQGTTVGEEVTAVLETRLD